MPAEWGKVEELYFRALALKPEDRDRFVKSECGDNPELRSDVLGLLSADLAAQRFLEQPALEAIAGTGAPVGSTLIGHTAGRYRILERAGGGAMGAVYRAEDLKLKRTVALKVLPSLLAWDEQMRHRLREEAAAIARLSHPHICRLYDVDRVRDVECLVMEFIEGETLAKLLSRGPLGTADALRYTRQIASALTAAHRLGIVHRDVKPGNIMITESRATLMDFGLSKFIGIDAPIAGGTGTMSGTVVGTAAYMSPEQARGEPVDGRTDVFSLGLVLYEMLTASRALKGDTVGGVLASLVSERPAIPADALSTLDLSVAAVIEKATQKNRERRFQNITEFAEALDAADSSGLRHRRSIGRRFPRWPLLAGTALFVLLCVAGWFTYTRTSGSTKPLSMRAATRNSTELPVLGSAISPDGATLAWADAEGLHTMVLAEQESQTIMHARDFPRGATIRPVGWTRRGSAIVFNQITSSRPDAVLASIWVVAAAGGPATEIRRDALAGSVSRSGELMTFTTGGNGLDQELWYLDLRGERSGMIAKTGGAGAFFTSRWSPDAGRVVYLYEHETADWRWTVESRSLDGSRREIVLSGSGMGHPPFWWLPDGRLLYGQGGDLWSRKMDPETGRAVKDARQLTNSLRYYFDPTNFSASSDGRRLTFQKKERQYDVLIAELEAGGRKLSGPPRRLTMNDGNDSPTAWTADGSTVLFVSDRTGKPILYRQRIDETNAEPVFLGAGASGPHVFRVSPDGGWIIYAVDGPDGRGKILRVPITGGVPEIVAAGLEHGTLPMCTVPPSRVCMLETSTPTAQLVRSLDPDTRALRDVFRIAIRPGELVNTAISPDGRHIAETTFQLGSSHIRVFSIDGSIEKDLDLRPWRSFLSIDFTHDSKAMYVSAQSSTGTSLLRVDMNGRIDVLLSNLPDPGVYALPSRDGRRIAIQGATVDRNVWVVDDP